MEKIVVDVGKGKVAIITYEQNEEFDIDSLTKIDISNMMGEFLTCPILLNQISILKAKAKEQLNESKLLFDVESSKIYKKVKGELLKDNAKVTVADVENHVNTDSSYIELKQNIIEAEKNYDIVEGMMWSIKTKSDILNRMFDRYSDKESSFELIEGQVNKAMVKLKRAAI